MNKNYIYLSLLLLFSTIMFGQKVTLAPTMVNGLSVTSGPINLGGISYSYISLSVKVEIPNNVAVGDQGTLKIYFSKLSPQNVNIAIGGDGGQLYFGGGQFATRNFNINLSWGDFLTSGGFVYAEYKNPAGAAYKSSNIAVIKNPTLNGGGTVIPPADAPDPTKISNTLCCNQIVRLGDKPTPITGSQYSNPYKDQPYGINSSWEANGNGSVRFKNFDNVNQILEIDHITEIGNFNVIRSLGYNHTSEKPNKSNSVAITVVPSPIFRNSISANEQVNSEGFIELSSLKKLAISGENSIVNLKVLEDPFYVVQMRDPGAKVDSYKWEYTTIDKGMIERWTTITNESSPNLSFSDPSQFSNFEDTYYLIRRIAIYKNISQISNQIKVLVRGLRYNNTICCDQILKITSPNSFENLQLITGSTASLDNPYPEGYDFRIYLTNYQWQSQSLEGDYPTTSWSNIPGATSKDYIPSLPLTIITDRRGRYSFKSTYKFRRIATMNYVVLVNSQNIYGVVTSHSNETYLDGTASQPYIQLYPNPTSSILNIESTSDMLNSKITISNVMGNVVNSNNFSVSNPKLINIDVANLPTGTYFITIENEHVGTIQKTFIKQ
ncbi:T9SS type A sorting domain-containing protein [Flavobacterium tructae]|uniref:Secretion system C-terminal sorting domain-containing protein n=1 Tax=Flavobacterium tructae TaxID=1114873 RepID=A0A1S1J796_9FLAO|nr:T9SS type A sorting domain-containing protein [Flavobacterium tructae]OHT45608.1 hypothetical protein BHE19_07160 [Flavobacterium tructae]OXB18266.1 hypothetical protein B0A71_15185 [Flavobacterium tructae]